MARWLLLFAAWLTLAQPAVADESPAAVTDPVTESGAAADTAPLPTAIATVRQPDDIDLETTAIKGSQELPRVLVIVPWKKALPGQLEGRPANSLLDEALAPVDREVFARQIQFYQQITDNQEPQSD